MSNSTQSYGPLQQNLRSSISDNTKTSGHHWSNLVNTWSTPGQTYTHMRHVSLPRVVHVQQHAIVRPAAAELPLIHIRVYCHGTERPGILEHSKRRSHNSSSHSCSTTKKKSIITVCSLLRVVHVQQYAIVRPAAAELALIHIRQRHNHQVNSWSNLVNTWSMLGQRRVKPGQHLVNTWSNMVNAWSTHDQTHTRKGLSAYRVWCMSSSTQSYGLLQQNFRSSISGACSSSSMPPLLLLPPAAAAAESAAASAEDSAASASANTAAADPGDRCNVPFITNRCIAAASEATEQTRQPQLRKASAKTLRTTRQGSTSNTRLPRSSGMAASPGAAAAAAALLLLLYGMPAAAAAVPPYCCCC
jgi:hypothetical protein